MRKAVDTIIIWFCVTCAVFAQESGGNTLSSLRGIYEKRLAEIKKKHEQRTSGWPREYVAALRALQKARQAAGDLDGWAAVDAEIKRFGKARQLTEDDIVPSPAELAQLQERCVSTSADLRSEYSTEVLSLTEKYTSHLQNVQKELTQAGKIEEAIAAREEIQRAKSLPVVTAAEFEAALHSAKRPPGPPVTPSVRPKAEAEKGWRPKTPIAAGGGAMLYGPGLKPPAVFGAALRHMSLSATANSPLGSRVSAKLWVASHSVSGGSYYSDPGKRHNVRARLVATGGKTFENATAVMQVYVKHRKMKYSYGSSGKIVPTVASTFRAKIPMLDREYVYFDSPRVPRKSRYGSVESSWYGKELYGVVLSILSSQGELLYQGASTSGLKDVAKARP